MPEACADILRVDGVPGDEIVDDGLRHEALEGVIVPEGVLDVGVHLLVDALHGVAVQGIVPTQVLAHFLQTIQPPNHLCHGDRPPAANFPLSGGQDIIHRRIQHPGKIHQNRRIRQRLARFPYLKILVMYECLRLLA